MKLDVDDKQVEQRTMESQDGGVAGGIRLVPSVSQRQIHTVAGGDSLRKGKEIKEALHDL
jgi:hypothetical protein